jgi:uncharacterized protein YllA (UPF0747 family)
METLPSSEMKPIYVSPASKMNEDIARSLEDVFRFASPKEYRDALMEIYQMYIIKEHAALPVDFKEIAERLNALMNFLKQCEE